MNCKVFKKEIHGRFLKLICQSCIETNVSRVDNRQPYSLYKHVVYGLYLDKNLVYIGVSGNYIQRFHDHLLGGKKFDEMRIIRSFKSREMADEFEKTAILYHTPPLNIAYNSIKSDIPWKKSRWKSDLELF